jgi:hypothetical protein
MTSTGGTSLLILAPTPRRSAPFPSFPASHLPRPPPSEHPLPRDGLSEPNHLAWASPAPVIPAPHPRRYPSAMSLFPAGRDELLAVISAGTISRHAQWRWDVGGGHPRLALLAYMLPYHGTAKARPAHPISKHRRRNGDPERRPGGAAPLAMATTSLGCQ